MPSSVREQSLQGVIVQLDRKFPLVQTADGKRVRCKHATHVIKTSDTRATIGDIVEFELLDGDNGGLITSILPRKNAFVRKDPAERAQEQILAANFNLVLIVEPLLEFNLRRVERACVLAFESMARVAVVLSKADAADEGDNLVEDRKNVIQATFPDADVFATSVVSSREIDELRAYIAADTAVLLGKSGAGKSSLVNALAGAEVQDVGAVREKDGKGRHTTVARTRVELPTGGYLIDIPGIRGLALWDHTRGLKTVFSDIEALSAQCKFRDCLHSGEPGCAVEVAILAGDLARERLESYRRLSKEIEQVTTHGREKGRSHTQKKRF